MNLFIDIETLPDQRPDAFKNILNTVEPPANYKKAESIQKWKDEQGESVAQETYRKTALKGIAGEVLSIAWALDDGEIEGLLRMPGESEADLLSKFFKSVYRQLDHGHSRLTWIGHNVIEFDLRFIKQRCLVNDVRPSFVIPADAKHGNVVFDTMREWCGWKGYVSQQALCDAFGIDGKSDMTGADVYDEYLAGNYKKILDYNKDDVRIVRELFQRMT